MLRKLIQIPELIAHYSIGSVVVVASLVTLGIHATRAERKSLPLPPPPAR